MEMPFAFASIDFETTGSVPGWPVEPWQIGVVRVENGEWRCWESWLQVGPRPFHPQAPGRHASLRQELSQAPRLTECLPELRSFCLGVPLVGHNVATEKKCLRVAAPMESFGPWIDTLVLARAAWPSLASHRLEDVLRELGLLADVETAMPGRGPHDALFDAMGSARLLEHLLSTPAWRDADLELLLHPDAEAYRLKRRVAQKIRSGT
jgi:DNA polymerase-3 subunit epsilon